MISTTMMVRHQPHFTIRAEVEYCCSQPIGLAESVRDNLRSNASTPHRGVKYSSRNSETEVSIGVSRHDRSIRHAPIQLAASKTSPAPKTIPVTPRNHELIPGGA